MFLGYNTNGLSHHDVFDAVSLLAEIGYRGAAITIDHAALSPHASYGQQRVARMKRLLGSLGMRSVVETGARFLLDPREKHEPTLLSESPVGRARRIDFYKYAVDCAAELGSDCVSLWSGVSPKGQVANLPSSRQVGNLPHELMDRLVEGLRVVLEHAAGCGVTVAFEPEPGMLIATMADFEELLGRIDAPDLRLTLDVGHLHCQGETPIAEVVRRWAPRLANVHLDDARTGVHEHLMFGEGQIDFPPVLRALADAGYRNGLYVELSRHSREGPTAAQRAFEFLRPMVTNLIDSP